MKFEVSVTTHSAAKFEDLKRRNLKIIKSTNAQSKDVFYIVDTQKHGIYLMTDERNHSQAYHTNAWLLVKYFEEHYFFGGTFKKVVLSEQAKVYERLHVVSKK